MSVAGCPFQQQGCCDEEALTKCQGFFGVYGVGKQKKPVVSLELMTGLRVTYMTPHILYDERCPQAQ